MKTLTVIFLLIFTSLSLKCMDSNELAQIRADIIKKQPTPYDLSFIQKLIIIGRKQDGGIYSVQTAVQFDIRNDNGKYYERVQGLSPVEDGIYSIYTPEFTVAVIPKKNVINLLKPQTFAFLEYPGILLGYDFKSFFDIGRKLENFEKDVKITKENVKIEEVDYKWIPCYKVTLEFYYSGQLQGGTKQSKVTLYYIFDKKNFLLHEEHSTRVNYNEDENIEESYSERVYTYEYLTPKTTPVNEYFGYKHLLDSGYTVVKK